MMIYMNNAATSYPKPPCVGEATAAALSALPGAMHRGGVEDFDAFDAVRRELAQLLHVSDPDRIALGPNATWGLNLAIFGIDLRPGDTVVTTKAEHNSVLRPLHALPGVETVFLDTDAVGRMDPALWQDAMERYRPRLAIFTHASNVTGAVNDASALCAAAKTVGAAVLVDLSQTLGWVDAHPEEWGADMAAFTGHKYLLGPQGTGGLWVRSGLTLRPHLVGGTGIHSDRDDMPEAMPLHLEAGTGNEPGYHGLLAALRWRREQPPPTAPVERLIEGLRAAGARVIDPGQPRTPVVSFTVPGEAVSEVGYILAESYDIVCRTGLHCAPKIFPALGTEQTVRLSLSRFTTEDEVEAVISAVEDIIG